MALDVSGELLSLFSSRIERRDDGYVLEIPASEIDEGTLDDGDLYRVAVMTPDAGGGGSSGGDRSQLQPPVEEGEIRYVEIEDIGKQGDGIARVERGYVIIVPDVEVGDRVKVEIAEVKENFAVADVLEQDAFE